MAIESIGAPGLGQRLRQLTAFAVQLRHGPQQGRFIRGDGQQALQLMLGLLELPQPLQGLG